MKFVYDDGGRAAAGFKGHAGDCVTRAVAIATGLPYREVYEALAEVNAKSKTRGAASGKRSARNGVAVKSVGFKRFMESIGWRWTATMKIGQGCKVHLADGELPSGRLIVAVSGHYTAVIDGIIRDTHDPQRRTFWYKDGALDRISERCVYGYWSKA